jgi:hypothetical protein
LADTSQEMRIFSYLNNNNKQFIKGALVLKYSKLPKSPDSRPKTSWNMTRCSIPEVIPGGGGPASQRVKCHEFPNVQIVHKTKTSLMSVIINISVIFSVTDALHIYDVSSDCGAHDVCNGCNVLKACCPLHTYCTVHP